MRFAIRDDDTCYFTRPEELDRAYRWLPASVPVSLAVTPFAVQSFHLGDPVKFYQSGPPQPLEANRELVAFLRHGAAINRWKIMCHGFTHEYHSSKGRLVGECVWKSTLRMRSEFRAGRDHLEALTGTKVDTFVPPGNAMSRGAFDAVGGIFTGVMAAIPLRRWPEFARSRRMWPALARRAWDQVLWNGPSLFPQKVSGLSLLASTALTPAVDRATLLHSFERCRRNGADFSVAVHYWELKDGVLDNLQWLVDRAEGAGCAFVGCPELLSTYEDAVTREAEGTKQWADFKIS